MLSIEQIKKIEPELDDLSENEIIELRNSFYELGQLIFDDWMGNNGSKYHTGVLQKCDEGNKIKL